MSTLSNRFVLGFGLALLLIEFAFPHLGWDARDWWASAVTQPKPQVAVEQRIRDTDDDRTGSIVRTHGEPGGTHGMTVWQYTVRPPESTMLMQHSVRDTAPAANPRPFELDTVPPRNAAPLQRATQL